MFPAAIVAAAWSGALGPGLVATVAAAVATDYFFLKPVHSLWISDPVDALALALFVLASVVVSLKTRDLRRRAGLEQQIRTETARELGYITSLQELTAALLRAESERDVIHVGLTELLHWFAAAAGAVVLADHDEPRDEVAHAIGYADPLRMSPEPFSPASRSLVTQAIRGQELIVIESRAARDASLPDLAADHLFAAHEAAAVVPLLIASRAIGVVILSFEAARTFDADERRFMSSASRHIAQAVLRARTYDRAEHARAEGQAFRVRAGAELRERQKAEEALRESEAKYRALAARTDRLYALSAGLSEAIALDAVAKVIVRQGKVVVGASTGSVALFVEGGKQFEILYDEDYTRGDGSRRFAAEPGSCSTTAATTRAPVYVSSFAEWQRQYPRSAALAADGGYASAAVLPLSAEGAVLGVLSFHFTAPVNFVEEYRALLESVAQHCAQALDRARLYEATERARAEAESANRSKDEFLSTVSHELRTPLNAMLGWAAMLRNGSLEPSRTTRAVEAIFNNATRQAHLIEELLDVSRIVAGRASLDLQEFDLAESLRGAAEAIMPLAEGQGVELRVEPASAVAVMADPSPARTGVSQSADECAEVHASRRPHHGRYERRRRVGRRAGGGHRARHRPRSSCRTSSSAFVRPTARRRAAWVAWDWVCSSRAISSRRRAEPYELKAKASDVARPSSSVCRSRARWVRRAAHPRMAATPTPRAIRLTGPCCTASGSCWSMMS